MINETSMRIIIKNTLNAMESYKHITDSDVNLVELTFLEQTNMENLIDLNGAETRGLMGFTYDQMESFICEVVRVRPAYAEDIMNIALIDVHNDTIDDMWEACSYNIAFQILLTYQLYRDKLSDMPIGADAVVNAYFKHWPHAKGSVRHQKNAAKRMAEWSSKANQGRFVA